MRNILFILPFLPYPLISGGHQAIFNGIKAVVNDYNVFITYSENETEDSSLMQQELIKELGNHINIIPYKKQQRKESKSLALRSYIAFWNLKEKIKRKLGLTKEKSAPSFFQISITDDKRILFLNDIIRQYSIDIVQCEMISSISDVLVLPSNVKKIYVQHQIDYVRCQLDLKEKGLLDDFKEELAQCKKNEIFLLNCFDAIIVLSEYDKELMQQDGVTVSLYVSPAIVTTDIKPFELCPKRKILSFVGPSMHSPNVNGIRWFLENCWKELKHRSPDFKLQIIGEWDNLLEKEIQKTHPEIIFPGYISNLEEYLKNTIMIVPINIGSGIRMKILEAVSLGIPVVSTSIGAQGLPLKDGEDCFITDSTQIFVEDILQLMDEKTQERMVKNAQEKIRKCYSFISFKKNRLNIYGNHTIN